jgi:apyrase
MAITVALYMGDAIGLGMLLRGGGSTDIAAYNIKIIPSTNAGEGDEKYDSLPKDAFSYITIVDAGSSGCRAHVYRYSKMGDITGKLYVIPKHNNKKIKPGLSSFASKPSEAGASLSGLVDFVKTEIPESMWSTSPIMLMATAGLRMLPPETSEGNST